MRAPLIAAGVAAAALAGWLLSTHVERGRKAAAVNTSQHEEAGDALATMNQRLTSLERAEALRRASNGAPPPADTAAPAAQPADHAAAPRPSRRTGTDVFEGFEQRFVQQGKDPVGSAQAEATIAKAFQTTAFAGSTALHVACGTTMCRVDVAHDGSAAEQSFLTNVGSTPPFDQGGFAQRVHEPGSDKTRTIVYFAREGYKLPSLDDG
jgi:hypothetical protein